VTLQRAGYKVITAEDGLAGMKCALTSEVNAVITDAVMPQMTGRELAHRLGNSRPDMRVLFMTGYTEHAVVESANGSALLNKPFSTMALLGNVRKLLDQPRN